MELQPELPAFLPREGSVDQIDELGALQKMLERPEVRGMCDDADLRLVRIGPDVVEKASRSHDDVTEALSARERLVDVLGAVKLLDGRAVELAVVALAQTRIEADGNRGSCEGELDSLDRPAEVRRVDRVDVCTSFAE